MGGNVIYRDRPLRFGCLTLDHPGIVISCISANTPVVVKPLSWAVSSSKLGAVINYDVALGTLIVGSSGNGTYCAFFGVSFSSDKNCKGHFCFYKNGINIVGGNMEEDFPNVGSVNSSAVPMMFDAISGDVIDIRVESDMDNTVFGITHISMFLMGPFQG